MSISAGRTTELGMVRSAHLLFSDMNIDSLRLRHSVRTFSPEPLDKHVINSLKAAITDVNTHEFGMRFQLVTDSADAFGSFKASYGMFKNVRNYIAGVVDTSYANYTVRAGFFGMRLLMHAFNLGLGTCFVSGSFARQKVESLVRPGEKLLFLIAIGKESEAFRPTLMATIARKISHRRPGLTPMDFLDTTLSWDKICAAFPKLLIGLEAVSFAPSAMNKQPVGILIKKASNSYNPVEDSKKSNKKLAHSEDMSRRYARLLHAEVASERVETTLDPDRLILQAYVPGKDTNQLLDLGVAMFSFQAVYPGSWQWGNPATFLPD